MLDRLESLAAAAHGSHLVPFFTEHVAEEAQVLERVVDHQKAGKVWGLVDHRMFP